MAERVIAERARLHLKTHACRDRTITKCHESRVRCIEGQMVGCYSHCYKSVSRKNDLLKADNV